MPYHAQMSEHDTTRLKTDGLRSAKRREGALINEARAARHIAIIDAATTEFNRDGVAAASLASLAKRLGLTRAGLYNYYTDRKELLFLCYQRTCSLIHDDLKRAYEIPLSGAERLRMFLKFSVDPDHKPMAILSELAFLTSEQQAVVRASQAENVALLTAMLKEGQQDGSIRDCDLQVICQSIFGLVSWAPVARVWWSKSEREFAVRMAAAIPDMILNGLIASGVQLPVPRCRLTDVIKDSQLTAREQRLEEFARTGSKLFNQCGISGVSLDDITVEMELTKGAFQYYFKSKSDFVIFCYKRAFDIYERIIAAAGACKTGLEGTMTAIELNVEAQLTDLNPLWITAGLGALPPTVRQKISKRGDRVFVRSVELADRAIAEGSLRPFDSEPVKLSFGGSFTYLSTWLPTVEPQRATEIAQEVSRFLLLGVRSQS